MAAKGDNPNDTYYEDYWSNTDYNKKYTQKAGANKKTAETVVETRSGRKIQQTYTDDQGYTFTIRQKKEGGKITYIAINKPNGDEKSEIRLNNDRLKDFEETTSGMRKKIMQNIPQEVIQKGASLAEIYDNFKDYAGNGVPYDERTVEQVRQEELAAQNNRDPYFGDIDYDFTINTKTSLASSMRAQRTMADKTIAQQQAAAAQKEEPTQQKTDTNDKNQDVAMAAQIRAAKSNTL